MNVEFINPFLNSISNVLATMATLEIKPGSLTLKSDNIPHGDVTGIITMTSPQTKGTLAISFSSEVILEITKRMLDEEPNSIDGTVTDLVGEITNMVTGAAKALLADKGFDFDLATPIVITGKDTHIEHHDKGTVVLIPFQTQSGEIFVEVCFEKIKK